MGRILVTEFVTVDGRMEDPHEWTPPYFDEHVQAIKAAEYQGASALLYGAATFALHAAAWPAMNDDEFGKRMNTIKKYVASSTADPQSWSNSERIDADPRTIRQVKESIEGDLIVDGSAQLVALLLANDLVDRLDLLVFPEIVGTGHALIGDGTRARLRLDGAKGLPSGVVHLTYDVLRNDA